MAMYVLLSFADDEDAMQFVEANLSDPILKVEGIYKKPTQFCNPMDTTIHGTRRVQGWTQGQKYGWWICSRCGKPSAVASKNMPNEIGGWNLLDRLFKKEEEEVVPDPQDVYDDRREHMDRDEGLHS